MVQRFITVRYSHLNFAVKVRDFSRTTAPNRSRVIRAVRSSMAVHLEPVQLRPPDIRFVPHFPWLRASLSESNHRRETDFECLFVDLDATRRSRVAARTLLHSRE